MELHHDKYNTQWCDKYETALRVLCLNTDYLFLGQEYWYIHSYHSISIHISSVAVNDHTEDMHTLSPLPYQMIWHKYDVNVTSLYFICFRYAIWFFTRHSILRILDLIFDFFKYLSWQDSNNDCIFLAEMQHSQPHMTLYCSDIRFNYSGNNVRNVESMIMILFSSSLASLRPPSFGAPTRLL